MTGIAGSGWLRADASAPRSRKRCVPAAPCEDIRQALLRIGVAGNGGLNEGIQIGNAFGAGGAAARFSITANEFAFGTRDPSSWLGGVFLSAEF
jgi:hypothetical protein